MRDAVELYMGFGLVSAAWVLLGAALSQVWEVAILLALPAVLWVASFVLFIGVVAPLIVVYEYAFERI